LKYWSIWFTKVSMIYSWKNLLLVRVVIVCFKSHLPCYQQ
jgi:hypothetical protein